MAFTLKEYLVTSTIAIAVILRHGFYFKCETRDENT